jgi:superfamily I DNA/RNA helicase
LRSSGIEAQLIGPDHRDIPDSTAARVATMHRAKGLEFDEVVIIGKAPSADPKTSFDHRRLLYVALTRAKVRCALIFL